MLENILQAWVAPISLIVAVALAYVFASRVERAWDKESQGIEKPAESSPADENTDFDKGLHQTHLQNALTTIRQRQAKVSNLSNAYIQKVLSDTVNTLSQEKVHTDALFEAKKTAVISVVNVMLLASASSNEFAGQRGLGLEQVVKFCETYLKTGVLDNRELNLIPVFRSFSSANS